MPFKSQAQRRKFYAMQARGQISPSVVKEWEAATPKGKKLPEKVAMAALVDEIIKMAFAVSQYSGPLGYGGFKQESYIPPFISPSLKTAGPPSQNKKKTAATSLTPAGRLVQAQRIGKPRATTPSGPSVAQISKPVGYGKTMPGAGKGVI